MDAKCLGGIILQKSADESYCIAKNPDPEKLEILTCYGEGIVDCQPNAKGSLQKKKTAYFMTSGKLGF